MTGSPVGLRAATTEDAPILAELAVAAYSIYLPRLPAGVRPGPLQTDYQAAVERDEVWVAELDDGVVAGFLILVRQEDHLLLENVAVHPAFQGRGIGRAFLELAEQRAAAYELPSIRLYTHAVMVENQQLYERWGYVETARRRDGEFERVFYEKDL
ncbi:ribosomal protein S18 acetylase RimI-like enzyme [Nocardioides thalensis]|uniref:Ribosomal protein S18 acetylase RimI-like enzyme n=1 Tax=Nocardioides thalensis TaxID=1914755 RepID=A0A853C229_9ACTN|nr:ribosomal protein S18 acetylase RimI-like enzyme [Nocardioides thalensis]